ncbi:universal stress protein [Mycolicibacterium chubuense]|uniref:Universal stress protein n=1 Tax=Mycolicibacterium chubuense TaxID=1800 RepID=A0A0J6WL35_MYCCU|nr:universal stress protein [Mycolicibacterium chubuense]KMO82738.1 Universal stress protein [Mycolicibacterium chubuense]SPY00586.1 universal stress protein UspA-like protein [Mycolicibacterium chubuense]
MSDSLPSSEGLAVVVGVDGSRAALNAVRWAAAEAVDRDLPLRIVHVVASGGATDDGAADAALLAAQNAALISTESVRAQRVQIIGRPEDILLQESRHAAMVCIGARPRRAADEPVVGRVAAALARASACPVAVIRSRTDGTAHTDGVISVVLSDDVGNDDVVHLAMHEGRLRGCVVRQIDRRADSWVRRYPDVHVETVAAGSGHQFGWETDGHGDVGLAVVGAADADALPTLTMPNCHPILGYPNCSLLLVRQ